MPSEPGAATLVASAIMIVAMLGTAAPVSAATATMRVDLCSGGRSRTVEIPVRGKDRPQDESCTMACHATDPRRRRAIT